VTPKKTVLPEVKIQERKNSPRRTCPKRSAVSKKGLKRTRQRPEAAKERGYRATTKHGGGEKTLSRGLLGTGQ